MEKLELTEREWKICLGGVALAHFAIVTGAMKVLEGGAGEEEVATLRDKLAQALGFNLDGGVETIQ